MSTRDPGGFERDEAYGQSQNRPRHRALEVTVGERGVEGAIRLFKKLVQRDGILRDLKRHSSYEKPGDRRRRKKREAARRLRKQQSRARARGLLMED